MGNRKITATFCFLIMMSGFMFLGCENKTNCDPFTISAIDEFSAVEKEGFSPFYIHRGVNALAVNSEMFENEYAIAEYTFQNKKGEYDIKITTVLEVDGESTYKLFINNKQVAQLINEETEVDFAEKMYDFGQFKLHQGDVIGVAFNNISNEKIIENEGQFAFARGRWKNLIFERVCN